MRAAAGSLLGDRRPPYGELTSGLLVLHDDDGTAVATVADFLGLRSLRPAALLSLL